MDPSDNFGFIFPLVLRLKSPKNTDFKDQYFMKYVIVFAISLIKFT